MALVNWSEAYSCHNPEIDRQHMRLFELLNELDHAIGEGNSLDIQQAILSDLTDYIAEHFAYEEAWMERIDYPERQAHLEAHAELVQGTLEFQLGAGQQAADRPQRLLDFLKDWLIGHILGMDTQIGAYAQSQGTVEDDGTEKSPA